MNYNVTTIHQEKCKVTCVKEKSLPMSAHFAGRNTAFSTERASVFLSVCLQVCMRECMQSCVCHAYVLMRVP